LRVDLLPQNSFAIMEMPVTQVFIITVDLVIKP